MSKLFNRAKMTVSSTGTGALTLGGATLGYQTFSSAGVVDGDSVSYTIEDGANWEVGVGTYTASGTTLSRTVTQSYNGSTYGTSPISVTSSAVVFITALAADIQSGTSGNQLVRLDSGGHLPALDGSNLVSLNAGNISSGTLPVGRGGTGATTLTGVLKGNGTSAFTAATAGTDYLAPPSGTAILKANSGGALADATAGTDYLAPPSGTSILKANSGGALANAAAGTDYLAPPSGTSILKANSGGALANATAGTDYVAPGGALGTPSSGTLTNCTGLPVSTGISGFGTSVAAALGIAVNLANGFVRLDGSTRLPALDGSLLTNIQGAAGGTGEHIFYENGTVVTQNYTITTGSNAGTFGPLTINSGVTVTVPSGSVWTIV